MQEKIDLAYVFFSIVLKLLVLFAMSGVTFSSKLYQYPNMRILNLSTAENISNESSHLSAEGNSDNSNYLIWFIFWIWLSLLFEYLNIGIYFIQTYF